MGPVGSPASAGIDPVSVIWASVVSWFPRKRGDRPDEQDIGVVPVEGSPASAGIDRVGLSSLGGCGRFPRKRGDRPRERTLSPVSRRVPPQARG